MECWTRDWHEFLNVAWQPVDVIKVCKMVMKVKLSKSLPMKRILKTFVYLIIKKWIEKSAKLKSLRIMKSVSIWSVIWLICVPFFDSMILEAKNYIVCLKIVKMFKWRTLFNYIIRYTQFVP